MPDGVLCSNTSSGAAASRCEVRRARPSGQVLPPQWYTYRGRVLSTPG